MAEWRGGGLQSLIWEFKSPPGFQRLKEFLRLGDSSMAEPPIVNRAVVGSNPTLPSNASCGECSSMAERQNVTLGIGVRFPSFTPSDWFDWMPGWRNGRRAALKTLVVERPWGFESLSGYQSNPQTRVGEFEDSMAHCGDVAQWESISFAARGLSVQVRSSPPNHHLKKFFV